jgi:predicted SAM-dependent methyltransferase
MSNQPVYVQFGCGGCAPSEWQNFDCSPRLRLERTPIVGRVMRGAGKALFPSNVRFGDIVAGLPIPYASADAIYASHVLEHLGKDDVERALANTFRILKPHGKFRMIVPDLEWRTKRYMEARQAGDAAAADTYMASLNMAHSKRRKGLVGILRAGLGNSGHTWMYDEAAMRKRLAEAGFVDVRRCDIGDSGDPMFDSVEDRGRFYESGERELALEARKPA